MPPLYQRIKSHITDQIAAGALKPGARVPSENELLKRMGASRMTVNRALRELTESGVLYRIAGVGTFVAEAGLQHPSGRIREIRQEIERTGHQHRARILEVESACADEVLAAAMQLVPGCEVFHSRILHCADEVPVMLEDRWVNPSVAPGYLDVDFSTTTPTRHLLAHAPLQRVEQTIRAVHVGADGARLLEIDDDPVLLVTRRTWTSGKVASVVHLYYVGTRYTLDQGADELPPLPAEFEREGAIA